MSDRRSSDPAVGDADGGDPACWLDQVCADCGSVIERERGEHVCRRPVERVDMSASLGLRFLAVFA